MIRNISFRLTVLAVAIGVVSGMPAAHAADTLNPESTQNLVALGARVFGVKWGDKTFGGTERGLEAVTDGTTTLTVRRASGVAILHNRHAMATRGTDDFRGSDDELRQRGLAILDGMRIDRREIASARVLQQFTQAGQINPQTRKLDVEPPERSSRTLLVTRNVDGVPVFSSRLMLNLNRDGAIPLLELVWPTLSASVREEAIRMRDQVAHGFLAPRIEGATVESVEAGIIHSPAATVFDDVRAAIRVIYTPDNPTMGRKAVRYVDLHGREIAAPRQIDPPKEVPVQRKRG